MTLIREDLPVHHTGCGSKEALGLATLRRPNPAAAHCTCRMQQNSRQNDVSHRTSDARCSLGVSLHKPRGPESNFAKGGCAIRFLPEWKGGLLAIDATSLLRKCCLRCPSATSLTTQTREGVEYEEASWKSPTLTSNLSCICLWGGRPLQGASFEVESVSVRHTQRGNVRRPGREQPSNHNRFPERPEGRQVLLRNDGDGLSRVASMLD